MPDRPDSYTEGYLDPTPLPQQEVKNPLDYLKGDNNYLDVFLVTISSPPNFNFVLSKHS